MKIYIVVMVCILILSVTGQFGCILKNNYPRKSLSEDVIDVLAGGALIIWGGVVLWG